MSILTVAFVWVLKMRQDIYTEISVPAVEILRGELPERYRLLKSYQSESNQVVSLFEETQELSLSIIVLDTPGDLPASLSKLISDVKRYRTSREDPQGYSSFLVKYLAAHIDPRRITIKKETAPSFESDTIPTLTFQLKDKNYFGLAYIEKDQSYLLASSAERVVTPEMLINVLRDIPRYQSN